VKRTYVHYSYTSRLGTQLYLPLHTLLAIPLVVSAFVDLPAVVYSGRISGGGVLTIVQVVLVGVGLLACTHYPSGLLLRASPYVGFLMWAGLSVMWAPPGMHGIQNLLVYLLFGLSLLFAGTLAARRPAQVQQLIDRGIRFIDWVTLSLIFSSALLAGFDDSRWFVYQRSVALVGLFPLSWHLSRWYFGQGKAILLVGLWMAAIILSLSRTAAAIAILCVAIVLLLQLRFQPRRVTVSLPFFLLAVVVTAGLVRYVTPFHDRVFSGDTSIEVGGMQVNASGRLVFWPFVVASAQESPWVGKGLGSSQRVLSAQFDTISQPHNDYLRVWHDLGLVGLLLVMVALITWVSVLFRAWYTAERQREAPTQMELAALLGLTSLMVAMTTDNIMIYYTSMGPLGIVVGAALGVAAQRHAADGATRGSVQRAPDRNAGIGPWYGPHAGAERVHVHGSQR